MIRVGLIGAGSMGRNHLRVLSELEQVEVVAVAEVNTSALASAARGRSFRTYASHEQLLEQDDLEAVVIAVPTTLHQPVACAAARRGLHVFVEKPIAGSVREAQLIADTAAECGVQLAVGHVERFNPAVIELKRRVGQGELGRLFHVHTRRLGPFPPRVRDVGVVVDLATHDIDVVRYIVGRSPDRLFAETARRIHTEHEDLLAATMRWDDDVVGLLEVNWLTPTKVRELTVTGENGMFVVNYLTQDLWFHHNSEPAAGWDSLATFRGVSEGNIVKVALHRHEPLRAELLDFVEAIRTGREPTVSGEDGIEALRLAQLLVLSGRVHTVICPQDEPAPNGAQGGEEADTPPTKAGSR